jgi:O-antigen ligase
VDLLREAFELIRQTKGIGVGAGQFADESSIGLTAHNAYVLAAAEAGIVGLVLFGLLVYASMKVPIVIWFGEHDVGQRTRRMASAVAVALSGAAVGIVFLSWSYKDVLYMVLASSAALYAVARVEDPRIRIRISVGEAIAVTIGMFFLLMLFYVGVRLQGR